MDLQGNSNVTPLMFCAKYGKPECLKVILQQADIQVDKRDAGGKSALDYAAQNVENLSIIEKYYGRETMFLEFPPLIF